MGLQISSTHINVGSGDWSCVLMLTQQALYRLCHLPSSSIWIDPMSWLFGELSGELVCPPPGCRVVCGCLLRSVFSPWRCWKDSLWHLWGNNHLRMQSLTGSLAWSWAHLGTEHSQIKARQEKLQTRAFQAINSGKGLKKKVSPFVTGRYLRTIQLKLITWKKLK